MKTNQFLYKITILSIVLFSSVTAFAQNIDLDAYKWQHRIVLVISEAENTALYKKQLKEFKKDTKGFTERKLLVFDIKKDKFRKIIYRDSDFEVGKWEASTETYHTFSDKYSVFKTVLIGLDGGVKRVFKNELLKMETLFTIIDGMFMRKQEMKKGRNL